MDRPHRFRMLSSSAVGLLALLLVTASSWYLWSRPAYSVEQRATAGAGARGNGVPQRGERLVDEKRAVRRWAEEDQFANLWIYGDLKRGFENARQSGKPLLVTYRCVP